MAAQQSGSGFTRRGFLGVGAGAAATTLLAACSSGGGKSSSGSGGGGGKPLKFWNMPWGLTSFLTVDKQIVSGYKPKSGLPPVTYQQIQWANFTQTFSTAIAANNGPAVSSGGGTQAFLFESQGKIAYADDVLESWKKNGLYADFLPGLIDTMKTKNGYAAVPYNLDMRVWWYNKDLLDKAGATPPTDWNSYEKACAALKKIGVYGYGTGSGAGRFTGFHQLVSHMINNGGGLFDENKKVNAVTPENIEAMDWVIGLVRQGYVDPRSATYTSPNFFGQVNAGKFGMWWDSQGTPANVTNEAVKKASMVGDPLKSPSGKQGALFFPNNIMMYKNTPSQKGSEAFLTYYYQNMKPLWTKNTGIGLPPLKSIADVAYKDDPNIQKIVNVWQPIAKAWGAPGNNSVFLATTKVDATQPTINFAQRILSGKTTGKAALEQLQNALK